MPIYEYRCGKCGATFEILQMSGAGHPDVRCPQCDSRSVSRLFSRFGFTSGSKVRSSAGGRGCASCRPSPGKCGSCGGR